MGLKPAAQEGLGAHGLEQKQAFPLPGPRGRGQNGRDGLAAHPRDGNGINLIRLYPGQPVAQAEVHPAGQAVFLRRAPGPLQRPRPQIRGHCPGNPPLLQQPDRQIRVVGSYIGKPRPPGHQLGHRPQAGGKFNGSHRYHLMIKKERPEGRPFLVPESFTARRPHWH